MIQEGGRRTVTGSVRYLISYYIYYERGDWLLFVIITLQRSHIVGFNFEQRAINVKSLRRKKNKSGEQFKSF